MTTTATYTSRYVAYATSQGFDPDTMMAVDERLWPGGKMAGYILWMHERWAAWRTENGRRERDVLSREDHASFDAFIGA